MKKGKNKVCKQCGRLFYVTASRSLQQFCSNPCVWENMKTQVTRQCKNCKKDYQTYISHIRHRGSSFCSRLCMYEWRKRQASKPGARSNRRRMRSGTMRSIDNLYSKAIRMRDKHCLKCGTTENLQCSHVIPKSASQFLRWNLDNAITLCVKHHIYWWHKYPHEATEWFDQKFPGLHDRLRTLARSGRGNGDRLAVRAELDGFIAKMKQ